MTSSPLSGQTPSDPHLRDLSPDDVAANQELESEDSVSDPALNDELGHDWTSEGGATEQGAATGPLDGVEESPEDY